MSEADQKPTNPKRSQLVHNGSLNGGFPVVMTLISVVCQAAVKVSTLNPCITGSWIDSCLHDAVGAPIMLEDDDDRSDTKLEAASSAANAPDKMTTSPLEQLLLHPMPMSITPLSPLFPPGLPPVIRFKTRPPKVPVAAAKASATAASN